jgi:LysR family nitrogen assimilation transcriptional regulator
MAREFLVSSPAWMSRIIEPEITAPLALCQSDHLPLSKPAQAVRDILLELVLEWPSNPQMVPGRAGSATP